ncbi:MAG: hypothetical protein ABR514_05970 [Chthoniobacterales bacterium]
MSAAGEERRDLDSIVIGVELTLASIIQGVALFFLIDNTRAVFGFDQSAFWLYAAAGLVIIFVFWSRSIAHTLTLIRWPLEFGHNFFYIACALGESLLFTRLNNPRGWFGIATVYAAVVWLLFIYDLRLIHAREREAGGEASSRLYAVVRRDQRLNILLLLPGLFVFNLISVMAIQIRPELFIVRSGHVWLAAAQFVALAVYLLYVLRFFRTLVPLITAARQEWHRDTR